MIANRRVVSYDSTIHGHGSLPSYNQDCWRCVHGMVELASSKHLFRNRPFWNWSGIVETLVLLEHFLGWNTDTKSKKSLPLTLSRSSLLSSLWRRSSCATANWTTVLKCVPPRATRSVTHGPYFRCFWFLKPYFLCFWFFKGPFLFYFFISAFLCLNCVVNLFMNLVLNYLCT